ncbi:DUF2256 domain-containing protein [Shewanella sp. 10N.261.52.F9]|uniref:DUF2256 domain-containing protein n=1 Tax=Shewanella sp. 10N.261.52.F9 TaxID=3229684 RepID=UPI00355153D9
MSKPKLASKVCVVCLRPFSWRKKWRRDWEQVRYCSKRCSGQRKQVNHGLLNNEKEAV